MEKFIKYLLYNHREYIPDGTIYRIKEISYGI